MIVKKKIIIMRSGVSIEIKYNILISGEMKEWGDLFIYLNTS